MNNFSTAQSYRIKAVLLIMMYALHSLSFNLLTAATPPDYTTGQKSNYKHQNEKKKKPYSTFIVNHVPSKLNQAHVHIAAPDVAYMDIHQLLLNTSAIPRCININQRFSKDYYKRYRLLRVLLI